MTTYEQVFDWFYALVEKDYEFFNYYEVTPEEAIKIAQNRASNYLEEAVRTIMMKALPQVDFTQRSEDGTGFAFDFTPQEALLIPRLMHQHYLFREFSYLKTREVNFTSSDLKVFDPSNARYSFNEMYRMVEEDNALLLDAYKNTDRNTGRFRAFDPKKFDIVGNVVL